MDLQSGEKAFVGSQETNKLFQAQLDLWNMEHGEFYASSIERSFSPLKVRVYNSSWNWARQDVLNMFFDIIFGRLKRINREIVSTCIRIMNRSNPTLVEFMQYHIDNCPAERGETYRLAKDLGYQLIANCQEVLRATPEYKDVQYLTALQTTPRVICNILKYRGQLFGNLNIMPKRWPPEESSLNMATELKLRTIRPRFTRLSSNNTSFLNRPSYKSRLCANVFRSLSMNEAQMFAEGTKTNKKVGGKKAQSHGKGRVECIPLLHLKREEDNGWEYSKKLTGLYLDCLEQAAQVSNI